MDGRSPNRVVSWCLLGVIVSVLLVGWVSHTPIRHLIQVTPASIIAAFAWRGVGWSRSAALPVFLIWLFLMTLIWLYLLRIVAVIGGTFSPAEILLTIIIGISSTAGLVYVFRGRDGAGWISRVFSFLVSAVLQIAALLLSFQPAFARR